MRRFALWLHAFGQRTIVAGHIWRFDPAGQRMQGKVDATVQNTRAAVPVGH
jgi:hypothetical protein